jgi:hypothetical protein
MADIVINTLYETYAKPTAERGVLGLGVPYDTVDDNSNYVTVTQESIERKLDEFKVLYNEFQNLSSGQIDQIDRDYGTATDEESVVFYLKKNIRNIIFKGGPIPSDAAGNRGGKWFDSYNKLPENGGYNIPERGESRFEAKRKCVLVLKDWVQLLEDILNKKEGLVVQPEVIPTTTELQDILESATTLNVAVSVGISAVQLNLLQALTDATTNLTTYKALAFFDESREYKTVLNFGNDNQYLVEAWRVSPSTPNAIQLKLLSPLSPTTTIYDSAFIVTEDAKTVIDNSVEFALPPEIDNTPSLRPFNINYLTDVENKTLVNNVTLTSLGTITGSIGAISSSRISYEDIVFRKWLTADFKSSELNIDFTDFNKFVHYGSAYLRIITFANKLIKLENLNTEMLASVSSSTAAASLKAVEKENIIRNFDPYEQFLYYTTESIAYSASADYADDGVEYFATGSWPKQSDGTVYSPTSGVVTGSWLPTFGAIAQKYDEQNQNYLIKHLPKFIQEDINSNDFLVFIGMFGHVMDNLKVYIDQLPNIYSKNPNPLEELTMDQVYEVATSFGLKLPNINSLQNLQSITQGTGSRETSSETWKRFLHSMIYLTKTKGSRTSMDALLNTYGISSPIVQIKETSNAVEGNYVKSNELTYGLTFESASNTNIRVPLVSSSIVGSTVQIRFVPNVKQNSSIITSTAGWAVDLVRHPSASVISYPERYIVNGLLRTVDSSVSKAEYGRIQIISGSGRTVIASSSYFRLFGDDYTNIMLNSQSGKFVVVQTDGDQILHQETASLSISSLWNASTHIHVGGSGSIKLNNFDGVVDEIRVWGENISVNNFISQSYDPGSYYGNTYTSSYAGLYVHVPFSQPLSSITSSATNESPYQNVSIVQNLPASGFTTASYHRFNRTVRQSVPVVGAKVYTNKKVNVAAPATFDERFIDQNDTVELQPKYSIKSIDDKRYTAGLNTVYTALSPADFTNQNIMRTMGVLDVNSIIGSPRYINELNYDSLRIIKQRYLEYYNKTVNPNAYIRFFKDLIEAVSEMSETMVPARASLLDGIVIESSLLDRNKNYLLNDIGIGGYQSKQFAMWSSSASYFTTSPIGAFTFDADYDIATQVAVTSDVLPYRLSSSVYTPYIPMNDITGIIEFSDEVEAVSSTPSSQLPPSRKVLQRINDNTNQTLSFATSSIADENSAVYYLEADSIDSLPTAQLVSGYARDPYMGIPASGSTPARIASESNTVGPFYNIPPRLDFIDVGTTTFFHKINGIYVYDIFTVQKTPYVVKLDTTENSPVQRLYAPITLLSASSTTDPALNFPGRYTATISSGSTQGAILASDLFSLTGVTGGTAGDRLRLYRNLTDLTNDASRPFATAPGINSGVLFDGELSTPSSTDVFPYTLIQTEVSTIYYAVDGTAGADITLHYFAYDATLTGLLPLGYLPRHYKFSRDNTLGIKRRNYLGCKETGDDAFKVSVSLGNTIIVNPTVGNTNGGSSGGGTTTEGGLPETDTITFGGGGTLNVT